MHCNRSVKVAARSTKCILSFRLLWRCCEIHHLENKGVIKAKLKKCRCRHIISEKVLLRNDEESWIKDDWCLLGLPSSTMMKFRTHINHRSSRSIRYKLQEYYDFMTVDSFAQHTYGYYVLHIHRLLKFVCTPLPLRVQLSDRDPVA